MRRTAGPPRRCGVGVPGSTAGVLGIALFVRGLGLGAAVIPLNAAAYLGLDRSDIPRATSAVTIVLRLGASVGTAVVAVILQHQSVGHAPRDALSTTFLWTLILTAVALVPAMFLRPDRPRPDATGGLPRRPSPAALRTALVCRHRLTPDGPRSTGRRATIR